MKKISLVLAILSVFSFTSFTYASSTFSTFHSKVEKYLQTKASTNPQYAKYYYKIQKSLDTYAKEISQWNKKALKEYISWILAVKLLNNAEKWKYKKLRYKNLLEKKVIQWAFDQKDALAIWLKSSLSKSDLESKLDKYLPKYSLLDFGSDTYLLKLPKNNPFSEVFLAQVNSWLVPELDFIDAEVVQPKAIKKFGEYSLRNMVKIEADGIQTDLLNSWKQVTVAILDTWIDPNHSDLKDNIWKNTDEVAGNGIDDDNNGYIDDTWGYDVADNDNDPSPGDAHWTHVAWTVAAAFNDAGVYGANSAAKLMTVKIFEWDSGYTDTYKFSEWVHYAVDNWADVINSSLWWEWTDDLEKAAVEYAKDHNVIMVVAAWNENTDASNTYPCANVDTICVWAIDQDGNRASFSNYGSVVDVAAPGVSILSTIPDNKYAYYDGTSMATPHVSAVVSIIKMYNPSATVDDVRNLLKNNSLPWPSELWWIVVDAKKIYDLYNSNEDDSSDNNVDENDEVDNSSNEVDDSTDDNTVDENNDDVNDSEDQTDDQVTDTTKPFGRVNVIARQGMRDGYLLVKAYDKESKIISVKVDFNWKTILEENPNVNIYNKMIKVEFVNWLNTISIEVKNEAGLEYKNTVEINKTIIDDNTQVPPSVQNPQPRVSVPNFKDRVRSKRDKMRNMIRSRFTK